MSDYEFELPWPPSVNVWKTPFRNRMILTKRGRDYRIESVNKMKSIGLFGEMLTGRLSVSLTLHPPTLRKYDIDNFCKSLLDGLTHAEFWVDDEQIDRLTICKGDKTPPGKIVIKVTKL